MNIRDQINEILDTLDPTASNYSDQANTAVDVIMTLIPTWEKVEDGLPEDGAQVLIYLGGAGYPLIADVVTCRNKTPRNIEDYYHEAYFTDKEGYEYFLSDIIYWQPITPPEKS